VLAGAQREEDVDDAERRRTHARTISDSDSLGRGSRE
jgi:hypothetical protein